MTSKQDSQTDTPCYTDYAIQEFVLERLSDEVSKDVQVHLESCDACQAMEAETRLEQQYVSQIRKDVSIYSSENCMDDSQLGQFIDHSLPKAEQLTLESHLGECMSCRMRLIALYRSLSELRSSAQQLEQLSTTGPSTRPELVLMMSKRENISQNEQMPRFPMRETGTDV